MIFACRKTEGDFKFEPNFKKYIDRLNDGTYQIDFIKKKRTEKQNRALHLFFTMLADELNGAGYDMKKTLREDVDIPWTPVNIKENLWRPLMRAYLHIESTKNLKSGDCDKVYEILNKTIGERTGVYVPWPSEELIESYGLAGKN